MAKTDKAVAELRAYRQEEGRELAELEARSRSRRAALLPLLEADPILAGAVELLKHSQAADGAGPVLQAG